MPLSSTRPELLPRPRRPARVQSYAAPATQLCCQPNPSKDPHHSWQNSPFRRQFERNLNLLESPQPEQGDPFFGFHVNQECSSKVDGFSNGT